MKFTVRIFVFAAVIMLLVPFVDAETWHLEKGGELQTLSGDEQSSMIIAISQLKQLAAEGKTRKLLAEIPKVESKFPASQQKEVHAFLMAEVEYSKSKFTKAMRKYDAFLKEYPQSPLYEAAIDRELEIGTAFLSGMKKPVLKVFKMKGYAEGEKILDKVFDYAGSSPVGLDSQLTIARKLEERGEFEDAYQRWSQISLSWPTGEIGKESLLAMGRCKHASYRGPKYDGLGLVSARTYYENFLQRYPQEAGEYQISKRLEQIEQQLAYKSLVTARYYKSSDQSQAANFYYQMVVKDWPQSIGAQMAESDINEQNKNVIQELTWKQRTVKKLKKLFL
ncbi:MAG: outer membrane protein assembly factor BamD [Phycisphaerae bacterium]|nr:outer membrane protein assembly factor BamD [Phycisphaerae bacterium]